MSSKLESIFQTNILIFPFLPNWIGQGTGMMASSSGPEAMPLLILRFLEHLSLAGHTASPLQAFTFWEDGVLCNDIRIYSPTQTTASPYTVGFITEKTL